MRKIISLAVLVFAISTAFAGNFSSNLNIRLSSNAPFKVVLDGQQMTGLQSGIRLTNLNPGQHNLQVFQQGIFLGHQQMLRVFSSNIVLTANAESYATVYPEIKKLKFDRIVAFNPEPYIHPDRNLHHPKQYEPYEPNAPQAEIHQDLSPVCGPVAMSPAQFGDLQQTLNNVWFDDSKLAVLKQALAGNYFTSQQVRGLMDMFSFESSKLEVAKLAYNKTVDPNNYYIVNSCFAFSSSIDELTDYVAMR